MCVFSYHNSHDRSMDTVTRLSRPFNFERAPSGGSVCLFMLKKEKILHQEGSLCWCELRRRSLLPVQAPDTQPPSERIKELISKGREDF